MYRNGNLRQLSFNNIPYSELKKITIDEIDRPSELLRFMGLAHVYTAILGIDKNGKITASYRTTHGGESTTVNDSHVIYGTMNWIV